MPRATPPAQRPARLTPPATAKPPSSTDKAPAKKKGPKSDRPQTPKGYRPPRIPAGMLARMRGYFLEVMPEPETELHYRNAYELVVAVVLSAQCTDVRVNKTTPALFEAFPTVADLAQASVEEVFPYIRSVSYPNNKSKHLVGLAQRVMAHYAGEIPETPEALETLPGVGRKTANVLASVLHQQPRIAVDTHVFRVANRLGLAQGKNPRQVEEQLMRVLPGPDLPHYHHWLILHGRHLCKARKPDCARCGLREDCRYYKSVVATGSSAASPKPAAQKKALTKAKAPAAAARRTKPQTL